MQLQFPLTKQFKIEVFLGHCTVAGLWLLNWSNAEKRISCPKLNSNYLSVDDDFGRFGIPILTDALKVTCVAYHEVNPKVL